MYQHFAQNVGSICGSHQHVGEEKNPSKCWPTLSSTVGQFCKLLRFPMPANILDNFFNLWNLFIRHSNFYVFPQFLIKQQQSPLLNLFYFKCWPKCCQVYSKSYQYVGWNVGQNVSSICTDSKAIRIVSFLSIGKIGAI